MYITVDTECTEERVVNGVVRPPLGYDLTMRGRFSGRPNGLGTDLIVRELARYDFRATFFVESLCSEFFGAAGLAAVCGDLMEGGHDIQLHLHPNFRRPEWRHSGGKPLPDNIGDYDLESQKTLLASGVALLQTAGVPRASILAFRAGNYGASNLTWEALRQAGFLVDSSLNLWGLTENCRIVADQPRIDLYEAVPRLWELPISCFAEGAGYRHLEITAISFSEMRATLEKLQSAGARTATIVTHPGEFFAIDDYVRAKGHANRVNITRFRRLLAFLDACRDRFQVRTVGSLARELMGNTIIPATPAVAVPAGSMLLRALRLPVQGLKRFATSAKIG